MKLLVVDVDLAHLWLNSFSGFLPQCLIGLFRFDSISLLSNTSVGDPGWCDVSVIPWIDDLHVQGNKYGGFSIPLLPAR